MKDHLADAEMGNGIATEIMHVNRRLIQYGTHVMENLNIGVGQLPVLKLLGVHGIMTQRQLAAEIRVTPATICGTIKRMERAGLVQRSVDAEDGRVSCVSLTEAGQECYRQAVALSANSYCRMLEGFSEEERALLRDFVHRMGENLMRALEKPEEDQ